MDGTFMSWMNASDPLPSSQINGDESHFVRARQIALSYSAKYLAALKLNRLHRQISSYLFRAKALIDRMLERVPAASAN